MTKWTEVIDLEEIPRLGARVASADNIDIAMFRNSGDDVFALEDSCPHKGGPLSQGIVHGKTVTCPLHNWKIDLDSGEALAPDEGCSRRFPVKIEDGKVYLDLQK